MIRNFMSIFGVLLFSQLALAQGSPLNASPGQPPPPEGWTREADPNGGIHTPRKKKNYRLRMGSPLQPAASPKPTPAD